MRKKLKLSCDGGDFGSKKHKRGYGGVWRSLHLSGFWSQAVGFVLCVWQESGFSRRDDVFIYNLLYKEFYKDDSLLEHCAV
jgi:hypothetical protein